jgi:hypothetical protein
VHATQISAAAPAADDGFSTRRGSRTEQLCLADVVRRDGGAGARFRFSVCDFYWTWAKWAKFKISDEFRKIADEKQKANFEI